MIDPLIFVRRFSETHIDLKNETGIEFVTKVSGKYLVEVCRDGKVIRQPFGPKMLPNLITTSFFDYVMNGAGVANDAWRNAVSYAQVGTGTTTPANSDIKLTTYSQNTSSLFTGGGNTYSNDTTNGAITYTWVYEFPAVGAGITYNEAGLAQSSATASGLSSHILFASGVVLNTGDNVRLTYSITVSIPSLITPITVSMAAVNGFNVSGSMKVCGTFATIFGIINSTDTITAGSPNTVTQAKLSFCAAGTQNALGSAPTTFPAVNATPTYTIISGATGSGSLATYTNGSLTRNQTFTWTPSQPATTVTTVQNIWFTGFTSTTNGLYLILTSAQTKANTNTLAITLSCTMARA